MKKNDDTGPQPPVISEWSKTLNDVTEEEFSSFTGSVIDFDTALRNSTNTLFFRTKHVLIQIQDMSSYKMSLG